MFIFCLVFFYTCIKFGWIYRILDVGGVSDQEQQLQVGYNFRDTAVAKAMEERSKCC